MIIKDKNKLQEKCSPVSVKEGEEIGVRLLHELRESENGIGLAANQIGINKRVCVVNVKEPLVLINPKIVEKSKEQFVFAEGCLSFPDSKIKTTRYQDIIVEADNHKGQLSFSANSKDIKTLLLRLITTKVNYLSQQIVKTSRMHLNVFVFNTK